MNFKVELFGVVCIFALIIVVITDALAQKKTDSAEYKLLNETIIEGRYTPRILRQTPEVVSVVSRKDIEMLNASTMGEVLQYVTGVSVETGTGSGLPNRSTISMNGFPANYILVLVDGVRLLTDHVHTGQNVDLIPVDAVEQIEIIRGASSAQYGSDAMGGVVNIITKKCGNSGEVGIAGSAGMHDTYQAGIGISLPFRQIYYPAVYFNYEKSGGMPVTAPANRVGKMGYNRSVLLYNGSIQAGKRVIISTGLNLSSGAMEWTDGDKFSSLVTAYVNTNVAVSKTVTLGLRLPYSGWNAQQNNEKNTLLQPCVFAAWIFKDINTLTIGADYWLNNFSRTAVEKHSMSNYGFFLQDDLKFKIPLMLSGAVRFDQAGSLPWVVSPKISMVYYPIRIVGIRASLSKGFHAPGVQEKYEIAYGHGGTALRFGNPDLKPEYSITANAGLELYPTEGMQIILNGYYSRINNMIVPVYHGVWSENPSKDVWMRENIDRAEIYGAEISLRLELIKNFALDAGGTYTYNRNLDTRNILPYFPGSAAFGRLSYNQRLGRKHVLGEYCSVKAVFSRSAWSWKPAAGMPRDNTDGLTTSLKNYQLLNAGIKYTYSNMLEVYVNADNLLGQPIENLDDAYTQYKGEIYIHGGIKILINQKRP